MRLPQFVEPSVYAVGGGLASRLSEPREGGSLPPPGVFLVSTVLTVQWSVPFPTRDPEPSGCVCVCLFFSSRLIPENKDKKRLPPTWFPNSFQ